MRRAGSVSYLSFVGQPARHGSAETSMKHRTRVIGPPHSVGIPIPYWSMFGDRWWWVARFLRALDFSAPAAGASIFGAAAAGGDGAAAGTATGGETAVGRRAGIGAATTPGAGAATGAGGDRGGATSVGAGIDDPP